MSDRLVDYSLRSLSKFITDNIGINCTVVSPDFDYDRQPDPNDLNKTIARPLPFATIALISDDTPPFSMSNSRLWQQITRVNVSIFEVKETSLRQRTGQLKQAFKKATHPKTGADGFMLYDFSKPSGGYFADAGVITIEPYQSEYFGPDTTGDLGNRKYASHTVCSLEVAWKDRDSVLLEKTGFIDLDPSTPTPQLSFPATLENNKLAVVFDVDATNQVRLSKIVDKTEGGFTWYNNPPTDLGHSTNLWEIVGTFVGDTGSTSVLPSATVQFFYATKGENNTSFIFKWFGVTVPNAPESDILNTILTVSLADGDNTSKWSLAIERNRGSSFSIDEVHCPILYLKGPVAIRANSTHIESQKRTRLLVPTNIPQIIPAQGRNTSLYQLLDFAVETKVGANFDTLPIKFQPLGFNALAAVDPTDTNSYLRCFYIAAEDVAGYLKKYVHQGIRTQNNTAAVYHFRCKQLPSFGKGPGLAPSEFGNDYIEPPYKVAVGAFKALDQAWWYDIAKKYREFALPANGMARRELNNLSSIKHGNIICANIMLGHLISGVPLYQRFLELQRNVRRALDNSTYAPNLLFSLWQNYLKDGIVGTPDYPVSQAVDVGVLEAIQQGKTEEMRTILYTQPRVFSSASTWMQFFNQPTMGAYDRAHVPIGGMSTSDFNDDFNDDFGGIPSTVHVDYGSPEGQSFFSSRLYPDLIQLLGPTGFYCDSVSGGWGFLTYDPPDPAPPQHLAHGGNQFVQGKRKLLTTIRELLTPLNDGEAVLMSETPEEGMVGTLDLTHEGLCPAAWHGILGEELIRSLGVTDVHYEAECAWPPLWQAVWHSVVPVGRFVMPLYTRGLASTGSPNPTQYPGLTANEWRDIVCYFHALAFVAGSKIIFQHYLDVDDFQPFTMDGGTAYTDLSIDPPIIVPGGQTILPAGVTIQRFLRSLHSAQLRTFAGQFTVYGTMNRPLPATYLSMGDDGFIVPDNDTFSGTLNPLKAALKVHPNYRDWVWPSYNKPDIDTHIPGLWDAAAATLPFNVPCVVHSTWTSPEGKVGLVLVNWTSIDRPWQALFEPMHLGIGDPPLGSGVAYQVHIVSEGVGPALLWTGSGSLFISAETHSPSATYGDFNDDFNDDFNTSAIYIDKIPAYSVKVITFTPT